MLFICGGAFGGLEHIIEARTGKRAIGFDAHVHAKKTRDGDTLAQVLPEDLMAFGLIPEFIGRLPVVSTVHDLDRDQMIKVLLEPKNALVKQYAKFFEMDGVELVFTDDALGAVADQALLRGTGARGLRAILEEVLLNTMYELPSRHDVARVVIDGTVVRERVNPTLIPMQDIGKTLPKERSA
jgi:ATP-dependent Clp protease ATP-binding subunit ClpX